MELTALNTELSFEAAANELLSELYQLIQRLHQMDLTDQRILEECKKLSQKCKQLSMAKVPDAAVGMKNQFENISQSINEFSFLVESKAKMQEVKNKWKKLAQSYEHAARELRNKNLAVRQHASVKPVNYYRNAYHISNAIIIYFLYLFVFSHKNALIIMCSVSFAAIVTETLRRFHPGFNNFIVDKVFGKVSRPEEHFKINSATYYLLSLTLMMAIAPAPAFLMALLSLGVGDPVANILGKKFGTIKIFKEKSLIGSTGFFVSSFIVCFLASLIHLQPEASTFYLFVLSLWVASVGTLVELYSDKLDDNMTIIFACTLGAWIFV